jgi:lipopolysaccharide biosynthesis glycosyltransferase
MFLMLDDDVVVLDKIDDIFLRRKDKLHCSLSVNACFKYNIGVVAARPNVIDELEYHSKYYNFLCKFINSLNSDEIFFNEVLGDKTEELPQGYNVQQYMGGTSRFMNVPNPKIAHFIGAQKPWNGQCGNGFQKHFTAHRDVAHEIAVREGDDTINVCFAVSDELYIKRSIISFYSIKKYTKWNVVPHIFLFGEHETAEKFQRRYKGVHFHAIDPQITQGFNPLTFTMAVFLKLLMNDEMKRLGVKKYVLLDQDIIFRTDISTFFENEVSPFSFAACQYPDVFKKSFPYLFEVANKFYNGRHANTHLVLLDTEKFSQYGVKEIREAGLKVRDNTKLPDEDVFRELTKAQSKDLDFADWGGLPFKTRDPFNMPIYHFGGQAKPWLREQETPTDNPYSIYLHEWRETRKAAEEGLFDPACEHYCGSAKANSILYYSSSIPAGTRGRKNMGADTPLVALKNIISAGRLIKKGQTFIPNQYEQIDFLFRGFATFAD